MRLASDTMDTAVFVQGPGSSTPSRQPDVELPTGRTLRIGVRQVSIHIHLDCDQFDRGIESPYVLIKCRAVVILDVFFQ